MHVICHQLPMMLRWQKSCRTSNRSVNLNALPIREALHRVAAEDITAKSDVPGHRNSAMDGYACQFADLSVKGDLSRLKLVGISAAGSPYLGKLNSGECIRIFTGGVVPDQLDTVVMQEDCEKENEYVVTRRNHKKGQHVRNAGEDISAGEIAVHEGQAIGMAELGLLASVGCESILVKRTPKVAFCSTGDELRGVGESLRAGDVYDSNRYTLFALLDRVHVLSIDLGVVRDNLDDTIATLAKGAEEADVIITTAGASVGDSDFVRQALESLGELKLWKVAMRPGRPLAFGKIKNSWFFGLPGNPVSVVVTFDKFVKPALRKLKGENQVKPLEISARCANPIFKTPGRLEFQRGDSVLRPEWTGSCGDNRESELQCIDVNEQSKLLYRAASRMWKCQCGSNSNGPAIQNRILRLSGV